MIGWSRKASSRRSAVCDQDQHAVFESAQGDQSVTEHPSETLLEVDLNGGIALPFSCCSGGCGACRVHITDQLHHVALDEPNAVRPDDRVRGGTGLTGAPQRALPFPSAPSYWRSP